MSSAIAVDPAHYVAASAVFGHDLAGGVNRAHTHLAAGLRDTAAMAGHDSSGRSWAQGYDAAATVATSAISSVQHACLKIATMLQRTGFNHDLAESRSDSGHRIGVPDTADYASAPQILSTCGDAPSAMGGSGDYPAGWGMVKSTVGFEWPDGRSGTLRTAATVWSAAARALVDLTGFVDDAVASIRLQQSPEVSDAVLVCQGLRGNLETIAGSCIDLSRSCSELASSIDKVHHQAITALKLLVAGSVATQVLGAVGAIFSFGASEVVAQTVETGEVAAVASEVSGYLAEFATEVGTALLLVSDLDSELLDVIELLEPVLRAELVTADTTLAPTVGLTPAESAVIAAENRLTILSATRLPPTSRWRSAAVLKDHFLRHGADFGATSASDYASKAAAFLDRAVADRLPMKIGAGGTIRVYDPATNTFGSYSSDGTVKTYFKPSGSGYWDRQPGRLQ